MEDHPRFLDGLWWLCRHAEVGASLVRQWGYPERVAWLIEHHEDCRVDDCELALLIAVDDGRAIEGGARRCEHG